jgi:hypothetical protein
MKKANRFYTGEIVPETGIYRVAHVSHRLPHEVAIYAGQRFPSCSKCDSSVIFELVHAAPDLFKSGIRIAYELAELEEDESAKGA